MKSVLHKILASRVWWLWLLAAAVLVNVAASVVHGRWDLTAEGRYTIGAASKQLIGRLDEPVQIDVLLKGNNKAGFRKLANTAEEMLQEFKTYNPRRVNYTFTNPLESEDDSLKALLIDSLAMMGLRPYTLKAQSKAGEEETQRVVLPGAVLRYKGKTVAVNFLKGVSTPDEENLYNNAEALLEYNFASAIARLTQQDTALVGYALGHGERFNATAQSLITLLDMNYKLDTFDVAANRVIDPAFKALVIAKPTQPFSEADKLKLDQFVMGGGKILWLIDNLYAEMDSLRKSSGFIAFDRGLNLQDLLFKYGVRINPDLLQDKQCTRIPFVIGMQGDKPQFGLVDWPYFPLLNGSNHVISKNLDPVFAQFPQTLDTVKAAGIRKTVLLQSGSRSRIISTPAAVNPNNARIVEDDKSFSQSNLPAALLLEGRFSSAFLNRLSQAAADTLKALGLPFVPAAGSDNAMIVVSDADIALNDVAKNGPLPMGNNQFIDYTFANEAFIGNCMEYLVGNAGVLSARGKDFTLRLLDGGKTEAGQGMWQFVNIGLPVLLVLLFGWVFQQLRKRKYKA